MDYTKKSHEIGRIFNYMFATSVPFMISVTFKMMNNILNDLITVSIMISVDPETKNNFK